MAAVVVAERPDQRDKRARRWNENERKKEKKMMENDFRAVRCA